MNADQILAEAVEQTGLDDLGDHGDVVRTGLATYVDARTGQERFTALSLPSGAGEYEVVAESDEVIEVLEPVSVSVPLEALFEPPR